MATRILSWNIKEFGKKARTAAALKKRVKAVADHIKSQNADIFGLLEVESIDIPSLMEDEFPNFDFGFTEGQDAQDRNSKEILVGWNRDSIQQAAFSQKRQFRLYNPYLRPGALLSFRKGASWFNVLFLHTDSGTEAKDFGNRFEMFEKIWSLRKKLDKNNGPRRERLIVMGDYNTMGLHYPRRRKSDYVVVEEKEIRSLKDFAERNSMTTPRKSHDVTWKKLGRNMTSDLDHVMVSDVVELETLGQRQSDNEPFSVEVAGWVDQTDAKRDKFLADLSDHCSLVIELDL